MAQGTIQIENRGSSDIFLTLNDLNAHGEKKLLDNQRVNADETISVAVALDGNGDANLRWRAVSTEDASENDSGEITLENLETLEIMV